jgi:FAD:protein FMN transferase
MKKYLISICIYSVMIFLLITGCQSSGGIKESGFFLKNLFEINVEVPKKEKATAQKNLKQATQQLQQLDIALNKLSPISEITGLNKNASVKYISISNDFYNLIRKSQLANKITNGYFDISRAPLLELFADNPNPRFDKITKAQASTGSDKIYLDTHFSKIRYADINTKIDVEQIQKGFAIDLVKDNFSNQKQLNSIKVVSGQTGYYGGRKKHFVKVNLAPNKNVILTLHDRGICTLDINDPYFKNYSLWSKYLEKEVTTENIVSVTVVAPNAFTAEALAYAFIPMGTQKSFELIKQLNEKASHNVNQKVYYSIFLIDQAGHQEVLDSRQQK